MVQLHWQESRHGQITSYEILDAIKESLQYNFGDFGLGSVQQSLGGKMKCKASRVNEKLVKYYNDVTNVCIVRTGRDQFRMVWNAITLITKINEFSVYATVIHVGGKNEHIFSFLLSLIAIRNHRTMSKICNQVFFWKNRIKRLSITRYK